jgi:hypothetical protein
MRGLQKTYREKYSNVEGTDPEFIEGRRVMK